MNATESPAHGPAPLKLTVLVLAAGASSRMRGTDKLVETVGGMPLLRRVVLAGIGTGLPVVVALAQDRPERREALQGLSIEPVFACGEMSDSLRAGLGRIDPTHAVLLLLADMPEIECQDLCKMISAYSLAPEFIYRATNDMGHDGHPVIFPAWARPALMGIIGDTGAKAVLKAHAHSIRHVPLPGLRATTDLDTPEDWAKWRKAQATGGHN
ncbi:nucleotidyltransferase family protein [Pseudorhodobacter wandonensis]|uniref:nucleotidyltransferase family protein n=1 Tax=Pseudorhodobacter wandonensis TaxID=1120568 RepID=UPI00067A9B1C|nr:nucleotidyltransferase family protein [Pseudorhodobacter wandonensis]